MSTTILYTHAVQLLTFDDDNLMHMFTKAFEPQHKTELN